MPPADQRASGFTDHVFEVWEVQSCASHKTGELFLWKKIASDSIPC